MKKFKLSMMMILMSMLVFSACGGGGGGSDDPGNPGDDPDNPGDPKDPTATLEINGNTYTYTLPGGTVFKAMQTPDIATTKTFPCNIDADGDYDEASDVADVPARFIMGETEVTYELWKEVYDWATDTARGSKKYTFANTGKKGGYMSGTPILTDQHPVTTISWYDMIVWCNALTEYYNANNGTAADLECVYYTDDNYATTLRVSTDSYSLEAIAGSQDKPYIYASSTGNTDMANCISKGFRLSTSIEWEFSARYIGKSVPLHSNYLLKDGVYYSKGNSTSGEIDDISNESAVSAVAVYGVRSTAAVKTKVANALCLYDMCGNVWERCFDIRFPNTNYDHFYRVIRGGSFGAELYYFQVGYVYKESPSSVGLHIGFRFCRSR